MAFLFSLRRRHRFIFHAALPRTCIPAALNKTTSLLRRGANFGFVSLIIYTLEWLK